MTNKTLLVCTTSTALRSTSLSMEALGCGQEAQAPEVSVDGGDGVLLEEVSLSQRCVVKCS